jgi:hypothetical protein
MLRPHAQAPPDGTMHLEPTRNRTMLSQKTDHADSSWIRVDPALAGTLERASRAISRLDEALDGHPLLPAFLYRARLEAVRRQAAVDGQLIDPWHLAAVLDGLRLRMGFCHPWRQTDWPGTDPPAYDPVEWGMRNAVHRM